MKICVIGINGIVPGKYNIKDPNIDKVHQLVEARKKVYAQVDLIGEDAIMTSDAILVSESRALDLIITDLEFVETRLERKPDPVDEALLIKIQTLLEQERFVSAADWTEEEQKLINSWGMVTARQHIIVPQSNAHEVDGYLLKLLLDAGFIYYLTVGGRENKAWLIEKGMTAREAAGAIHSDIEKGFIRAEIIKFNDLLEAGGETQARRAGKLRLEQKDYIMQHCDVVNYRFNKS